jgi:ATP/maltotriose-dependent transcriptional regulator MalT
LSAACLVNLDLQQGESSAADLQSRIDTAIEQAKNTGDSYSEAFSRIIKAQVLLPLNKVEAQKEAKEALELAGDNQSDNDVSARIVLAEIESMNGNTSKALAELDSLKTSTYRQQNVGQNIEVRLTSAKLMKQSGSAKQRSEAPVLLVAIQKEAQEKHYRLLEAKAKAILTGKT